MRKITLAALLMTMTYSTAHAEIDDGVFGGEDIEDVVRQPGPFRIDVEYEKISKAKIDKRGFEHQHLVFSQFSTRLGSAVCYSIQRREALAFALGYDNTQLNWPDNPYFCQENFGSYSASLRLYSNRLSDWIWRGQLTAFINSQHWDFNHYLYWDAVMWGRYEYGCNTGMHIGFIVETGMKIDHVYPIFGFDWKLSDSWKINLVYPVDLSIEYIFDKNWSANISTRFFDERNRTGWNEPLPGALFRYTNAGIELGVVYKYDPFVEINLHAGSTLKGGELKISDKNNHHTQTFDIDGSYYGGVEAVFSF